MTKKRKIIVTLVGVVLALAAAAAWLGYTVVKSATLREVEPDSVILGVNFVGLFVEDLDAAEAYYANSVGTQAVEANDLLPEGFLSQFAKPQSSDSALGSRLVRSSNAQLLLMGSTNRSDIGGATKAVPVNGTGIAHVCFQVARETDAHARMLAAGGKPLGVDDLVHLNPQNPVYYGYVADPQGIITEIEEVDVAALNLPEPPKNKYRIRHVSLATPDLDAMIAFYSAFLGGQEARHVGWLSLVSGENVDKVSGLDGSELEMAWFQIRNLELEIFQYHSHTPSPLAQPRPLDAPGYNMIVLDVSSLDEARQRLMDAGGEIVSGPEGFASGEAIFGRDPDGNLLVLHKVADTSPFSAKNFANNGTK
ncbi:VOC family protein [Erythrobacter sp. F6033]|uniref:VOC family protein n=1 Tax=Erythrobacter sp. F6033 TaxID=2926401 RepID=UPI001FF1186C|nr:VOC family protein [Erythrobacter sp. F6033]MCK0127551.1 VOC family protein [Erythrobacter sp. F6033]